MTSPAGPGKRGEVPGRPRPPRRSIAMPLLFVMLTLGFVALVVFAAIAHEWVFVAVGAALAAWMATFVRQAARRRG